MKLSELHLPHLKQDQQDRKDKSQTIRYWTGPEHPCHAHKNRQDHRRRDEKKDLPGQGDQRRWLTFMTIPRAVSGISGP